MNCIRNRTLLLVQLMLRLRKFSCLLFTTETFCSLWLSFNLYSPTLYIRCTCKSQDDVCGGAAGDPYVSTGAAWGEP